MVVGIAARLNPVKDMSTLIRGFAEAYKTCEDFIIAVDGGDHRQAGDPPEQGPNHVGPGPVAVDELEALPADILRQLANYVW